jgi:hypothetical protein
MEIIDQEIAQRWNIGEYEGAHQTRVEWGLNVICYRDRRRSCPRGSDKQGHSPRTVARQYDDSHSASTHGRTSRQHSYSPIRGSPSTGLRAASTAIGDDIRLERITCRLCDIPSPKLLDFTSHHIQIDPSTQVGARISA